MRYILLICSALMLSAGVSAKTLTLSEQMWDFGVIAEEGGEVSHIFTIKNDGTSPIVIQKVVTSCGCTTPEYTRRPILAGESTELKITFDPKFRPGNFTKSINLYTTESSKPKILKIMGSVTPRVLPLQERYPYKIGEQMRIADLFVSFRAVPQGRLVQQTVEYRNMSENSRKVEFRARAEGTPLQIYYTGEVEPNGSGSLEVAYYVERGRGRLADTLDMYIDGRRVDRYISIKGLIVE